MTHLYAIIDDELFTHELDPRDFDYPLTFERDGQRYQRKLGDCDREHVQALRDAMAAYVAIGKAELNQT